MKRFVISLLVLVCLIVVSAANEQGASPYVSASIEAFKKDAKVFADHAEQLKIAVAALKPKDKAGRQQAIARLRACRLSYKRIEAFMEYFFEYPVNLYNRAPVYELEEPYMEYQSPVGLQYIEGLLLDTEPFQNKEELRAQCEVVAATAKDIPGILYGLKVDDAALLEANRLELIRISTLSITGYDAPLLKSALEESATALGAMKDNLEPLLIKYSGAYADAIRRHLGAAIALLEQPHQHFDRFDRLAFFTHAMLPLQEQLSAFISAQQLDVNTHPALNHNADHLFSPDAINPSSFPGIQEAAKQQNLVHLGKRLFSEQALSGNNSRSCASCHRPDKAFTDGLIKSRSLDGKSFVMRNTPSLYYAVYQHAQFYDGRVTSLEAQIKVVLQSPLEMNISLDTAVYRLNQIPHYKQAFKELWPSSTTIQLDQIAAALVAYEQTLAPFRSRFDRYIAGDKTAMNPAQKRGFNLFMGKASCGSCHFAPLFNGLLPPYYDRSELEVIGVPQQDAKGRRRVDTDSGRFHFFPISFNNGAFKTTSVRNAAATAPYMHNGVFRNLNEVLDFYNRGGGRGMGLKVPGQTLSEKPLGLTKAEMNDIIAFLQALDDDAPRKKR
ncbi:cytochrome C peroxidase [Taibaiella sp. KBW10]|uniref:cytochrome-c peroxidase n=1 Tax=Taibaiella sp. KBW10 TaxID=2153357 RepID=UPI000F5A4201|nr:cytochrome c peroxidase [Taibaiella sp. KBW10]RQO30380.1 cytochrome C peroxidase [Taibaiella sp. KBW10]